MPDNYYEPDYGRSNFEPNNNGDDASLDALARSDRFIEALASDHPLPAMGRADYELASLLADWRDDMRYPDIEDLVTEKQAASALRRGLSERRGRRGLAAVASVAAAVAFVGGFGTMTYNAQPGDALYGLRTSLFGEPPAVRDDHVVLAAQTEMEQVKQLIDQGQWEQAQAHLETISTQVDTVADDSVKQELLDQWNQLNVQVETRDPNATVPPETEVLPQDQPPVDATLPGESTTSSSSTETSTSGTSAESTTESSSAESSSAESSTAESSTAESSTSEPSTQVEVPPSSVPPTSASVVTPPPSTPVSAEPPPPTNTSVVATTTTTTTTPAPVSQAPVEPPSSVEVTVVEPAPEVTVAPAAPVVPIAPVGPAPGPAISGGEAAQAPATSEAPTG